MTDSPNLYQPMQNFWRSHSCPACRKCNNNRGSERNRELGIEEQQRRSGRRKGNERGGK